MKIIISPCKTQNSIGKLKQVNIANFEKVKYILDILKNYSKEDLGKNLNIKNKLLDHIYNLYHSETLGTESINLYTGTVFKQINYDEYNFKQKQYTNNHLVILSAMYGAVEPNRIIWPYRLDMTNNIDGYNLYKYWEDIIISYFKEEKVIINLASKEYSKMLKCYKDKLINIHFMEKKNEKLKVIGFNAKKARGKMVDLLIRNQVKDKEAIKTLVVDNYIYNNEISDKDNLYFIK